MTDGTRRFCSNTAGATVCNVSLNPHAEEFIPGSSARVPCSSQLAPSLASSTDTKAQGTIKTLGADGISQPRRTGGRRGRNNRKYEKGGVSQTGRDRGRSAGCRQQVDVQDAAETAAAAPSAAAGILDRRARAPTPKYGMARDVTQGHSNMKISRADGLHGRATPAAIKADTRNSRGSARYGGFHPWS